MNKRDLIEALTSELNLSSGKAKNIVNIIVGSMAEELVNGGTVEIRGFGSFTVRNYESYQGKNLRTGEKTFVIAKKRPFFRAGKELREAVNNDGSAK